ncbi:MAG: hypothetical protein V3W41_11585 [Planctomycetota bacterium]
MECRAGGAGPPTTYFRTDFSYHTHATTAVLPLPQLAIAYDDAFVAYLNGAEVARSDNLPNPAVFSDLASPPHEATRFEFFDISAAASALIDGTNVLAVELHNCAAISSDAVFFAGLFVDDFQPLLSSCSLGEIRDGLQQIVPLLTINGSDGGASKGVDIELAEPIVVDFAARPLRSSGI